MNDLKIFNIDDWATLYVNGENKCEGHDIHIDHISEFCPIESITRESVDGTELEKFVSDKLYFPKFLDDVNKLLGGKIYISE